MQEIILILIVVCVVLAAAVLWKFCDLKKIKSIIQTTKGGNYKVDSSQPVRMFVPTIYFVAKDLIKSIKANGKKREKRLKRLDFLVRLHKKLLKENMTPHSAGDWELANKKKDIMDLAEETLGIYSIEEPDIEGDPLPLFKDIPEVSESEPLFSSEQQIIFEGNKPVAPAWKTELNSNVSKIFNTSLIYREAHYDLYRDLVNQLGKLEVFGKHFGDISIIPVFKGGEIYRRVIERNIDLLSSKEDRAALKKELYGLFSFGDVDTSLILTSSKLKFGKMERESVGLVSGLIMDMMISRINGEPFIDIEELWSQSLKKSGGYKVYNGETLDLKLDNRLSFQILPVDDKVDGEHVTSKYILFSQGTGFNNLYVSKNDIQFTDEKGHDTKFTLVRNKVPMIASQRQPDGSTRYVRCAAEGLDISIMYPYDQETTAEILEYKKEIDASGTRHHSGLYFEDEAGSGIDRM